MVDFGDEIALRELWKLTNPRKSGHGPCLLGGGAQIARRQRREVRGLAMPRAD